MSTVTARSLSLRDELARFPRTLVELLTLKDDAYYLMLSSKPYDGVWANRGNHRPSSSQVERIVVNFLTSSYISHLESFTHACENLLADLCDAERAVLLSFWRSRGNEYLPESIVMRYEYYRDGAGLPDDFLLSPPE